MKVRYKGLEIIIHYDGCDILKIDTIHIDQINLEQYSFWLYSLVSDALLTDPEFHQLCEIKYREENHAQPAIREEKTREARQAEQRNVLSTGLYRSKNERLYQILGERKFL